MTYQVSRQYGRETATVCDIFKDLAAAKQYIAEKLGDDLRMDSRSTVVYKIEEEFGDAVAEYSAKNYAEIAGLAPTDESAENAQGGSQGQGSSASFKPTPFNTTPRPKGSPQGWVKDQDEEKDK